MKRKKTISSLLVLGLLFTITSCKKDDPINNNPEPNGDFTVERSGTFVAQNSTPTSGTVEYGKDEDDVYFVHLGSDFSTDQATGTLGLYFSTSETFTADPGNGNPDLQQISTVTENGEQYFMLDGAVGASFTHVILWCNTAGIPFGYAKLQ
ncbi:MAG: DM13 domain-containing protein [Crocinitomicaceae bacterium]|nr:DM13 domain-containing protein [Crocinitomicaceae bacterium]